MRVYRIGTIQDDHGVLEVVNHLKPLQDLVGGYIEVVYIPEFEEQGIILLANEEGLLKGLDYNENMWPFFYVGNLVALSTDGEEFASLTEYQIQWLLEWFDENEKV